MGGGRVAESVSTAVHMEPKLTHIKLMRLPLSLTSSFLSYLGDHTRETAPRTSEVFPDQRDLHRPSLPSHIPGSVDCCRFLGFSNHEYILADKNL
jgi:hypothetical protein